MVQVIFISKISWNSEEQRYRGEVSICLPATEEGNIITYLRNKKVTICICPLTATWGSATMIDGKRYRYKIESFSDEDLINLQERINEYINDITSILKEIYKTNIDKEKAILQKEVKTILILNE